MNRKPSYSQLWFALRLTGLPFYVLGLNATAMAVLIQHQRVSHATALVLAKGVTVGMDITTACALSGCQTYERNLSFEGKALQQLSSQLYAYTPYIQTWDHPLEPGLVLELSRCLKLFKGIKNLVKKIQHRLNGYGYEYSCGLAHTAEGAWLLSAKDYGITGQESSAIFSSRLKSMPLKSLSKHFKAVTALGKSGFNTLGDVALQIERDGIGSIKKRFGTEFTQTFCDIFAIDDNFYQQRLFSPPAVIFQPKQIFSESLQFDYPLVQAQQLQPAMLLLLDKLEEYFRIRQLEGQRITWQLLDIYGNADEIVVQCDRPQYKKQLFYELSCIRLENYVLNFEVDTLILQCPHTLTLQNRDQPLNLEGNKNFNPQKLNVTVEKLKAYLGEGSVYKISYCDRHVPELSQKKISVAESAQQNISIAQKNSLRPCWLFESPQRAAMRGSHLHWQGKLSIIEGPERIQTEWWDKPVARDYFIAQRDDALRLWVYQDLHNQLWYVHGVFA